MAVVYQDVTVWMTRPTTYYEERNNVRYIAHCRDENTLVALEENAFEEMEEYNLVVLEGNKCSAVSLVLRYCLFAGVL